MSEKKQKLDFFPAKLVEGDYRWYIQFYQELPNAKPTDKMKRFRRTFNINRIKDILERRRYALRKVKQTNRLLRKGEPYIDPKDINVLPHNKKLTDTNILEALALAEKIKCNTDRKRTIDMVTSICNIFREFLDLKRWTGMTINSFGRRHAVAFLDYGAFERKIGARTYNNYIERMKAILNELVEREYLEVNPFAKMKKKKITGKRRRAFSEEERGIVATEIKKDKWLWLGVQLQFYCFIRPIEQRRMRIHMIDLNEGVIRLPAETTKNKESAIITIPNEFLEYLRNFGFEQYSKRSLIFGAGGEPNMTKCCGHNMYNSRHKKILEKLFKVGKLGDINGLQYYSWKDTGAVELFKRKVNILEIMRQLRHKDLSTTQKYCQSLYVINMEIRDLVNPILKAA